MKLFITWLVLVTVGTTALAEANAPVVRKVSLSDCLQAALEKNLDLRIARYTLPMAILDLKGSYADYDPTFKANGQHEFDLSGGGYNSSINASTPSTTTDANAFYSSLGGVTPWGLKYTLEGSVRETYGTKGTGPFDSSVGGADILLTQPLLRGFWIDQTRLTIRINKNRVKYTELGLKQTIMATVTTVEQAYYDLIAARENVTSQEKAVELAKQLVVENKKRVEVGALAPLDEKQAESQAASSQADLINARNALAVQQRTLKQLMGDDFAAWQDTILEPTATLAAGCPKAACCGHAASAPAPTPPGRRRRRAPASSRAR